MDVVRSRHVLDVCVKGKKQAKEDAKITALSEESHGYTLCSFWLFSLFFLVILFWNREQKMKKKHLGILKYYSQIFI